MEGEKFQGVLATNDKPEEESQVYHRLLDAALERRDRRLQLKTPIRDCQSAFNRAFEKKEYVVKLTEETQKSDNFAKGLQM